MNKIYDILYIGGSNMIFQGLITNNQYLEISGHEINNENLFSINDIKSCFIDPEDCVNNPLKSIKRDFNDSYGVEIDSSLTTLKDILSSNQNK